MRKLLFLLLTFPLFLASCSSDDEKGGDDFTTIALTGKATAHNKVELGWTKVENAYTYKVFYQAEGETKWEETNFIMAPVDQSTTVRWDGGGFTYFNADVKYTILVKAFRDSREGSVIGESNKIEITTPNTLQSQLLGKWNLRSTKSTKITTNIPAVTELLKAYFDKVTGEDESKNYLEFKADGTSVEAYFYDNHEPEIFENKYSLNGNSLTIDYTSETVVYEISISGNKLYRSDEVVANGIEFYTNQYKSDYPNLKITEILLLEEYVRMD